MTRKLLTCKDAVKPPKTKHVHHRFVTQMLRDPSNRKLWVVYDLHRVQTTDKDITFNAGNVHMIFKSHYQPDDVVFEGYSLPTIEVSKEVMNTWSGRYRSKLQA